MKNDKFDYFEPSPHPRQLKLITLDQGNLHNLQDAAHHDEQLFNTPARSNIHFNTNPAVNIDPYFTYQHKRQKKEEQDDYFGYNSRQIENAEEEYDYVPKIEEKVEFSQELIIPITPAKVKMQGEENISEQPATRKKTNIQYTPLSETISHERGLKKLAYQAFNFVTRQKKTTYKEVAAKLINQLNDEQIHGNVEVTSKRGEMNIKRRVYDALNVLIALGLLKRNGNRIVGTKTEIDKTVFEKVDLQKQKKKQQLLSEELQFLRQDYLRKADSLKQKEKIFSCLKDKMDHLRKLQIRNKKIEESDFRHPMKWQDKKVIEFPFVMVGIADNRSKLKVEKGEKQEVVLWQQDQNMLVVSYSKRYSLDVKGDLDLISNMSIEQSCPDVLEKIEKRRNRAK